MSSWKPGDPCVLVDDGRWNLNRQHIGRFAKFAGVGNRCQHGNGASSKHECYVDLGEPPNALANCSCLFVRYVNLRRIDGDWQRQETTTWDRCAWAPGRGYAAPPAPTQLEVNEAHIDAGLADGDAPRTEPRSLRWPWGFL